MNIIFLGPPGAGKGTHANIISAKYQIPHISTGDILRMAIANQTETGLRAKEYMDKGQLVPDQVVIDIVKERLAMADCADGYILDGFPRTVAQAEELGTFAKIDVALNLMASDQLLVERLSGRLVCPLCGAPYRISALGGDLTCRVDSTPLILREDDKPETVAKRLEVYHEKTAPLIDYYGKLGLLRNVAIDGGTGEDIPVETVAERISKALEEFA